MADEVQSFDPNRLLKQIDSGEVPHQEFQKIVRDLSDRDLSLLAEAIRHKVKVTDPRLAPKPRVPPPRRWSNKP